MYDRYRVLNVHLAEYYIITINKKSMGKMKYSYRIKKDEIVEIFGKGDVRVVFKIMDEPNKEDGRILFNGKVILSNSEGYVVGDSYRIVTKKPSLFGLLIHEVYLFICKKFKIDVKRKIQD